MFLRLSIFEKTQTRLGNVALLIEYLPSTQEALGSNPPHTTLSMVGHPCYPCAWKVGQKFIFSWLDVSLDNMRLHLTTQNQNYF